MPLSNSLLDILWSKQCHHSLIRLMKVFETVDPGMVYSFLQHVPDFRVDQKGMGCWVGWKQVHSETNTPVSRAQWERAVSCWNVNVSSVMEQMAGRRFLSSKTSLQWASLIFTPGSMTAYSQVLTADWDHDRLQNVERACRSCLVGISLFMVQQHSYTDSQIKNLVFTIYIVSRKKTCHFVFDYSPGNSWATFTIIVSV